jgi:RNA 2',3'-cyclic 3'-phosphodiesterase
MRLFVAIVLPPAVVAAVAARLDPLRPAWPSLRWAGPDSWHLTLAFLGEVPDPVRPELAHRLERAAGRHPALDLAVSGGGTFPGPARARVVWAGIRADQAALRKLAGSVAAGARRAGAPPPDEGRRYRPHVTLARLREPADVRPLAAGLAGLAGPPWTATEIQLIRSEPGSPGRGPVYTPLASWPLTAKAQFRRPPRRLD